MDEVTINISEIVDEISITVTEGLEDAPADDKTYARKNNAWTEATGAEQVQSDWNQSDNTEVDYIKNKPTIPTRDALGLDTDDSPEFANTQITTLEDATSGGVIPDAQWTWLGATAKSVISALTYIINYIYSIKDAVIFATPRTGQTLSGAVLLDRCFTGYNSLTLTGALEISVGASPVIGGYAEGVIVGNGTNTPTLSGITIWPTSAAFDPTNLKQNKFTVLKFNGGVYINWTQMN